MPYTQKLAGRATYSLKRYGSNQRSGYLAKALPVSFIERAKEP